MSEDNVRQLAKRVVDLSAIGLEVGVYRNPVGNFSLAMLPNGNWLCSMRRFGYHISTITQAYLTSKYLKLDRPDEQLFLELDVDFNLVRQFHLVANEYYKHPIFNSETPYLEDGRLTQWGGDLYFVSAIFYQNNGHYDKFGMEIQRLEIDGGDIAARHVWSSVENGMLGRHKNWMGIPDRPLTYVVGTSSHGAQILEVGTGSVCDVGTYDAEDLYRGNTPLVKIDGGYLAITHKLVNDDLGRKRYLNYFVVYDEQFMPTMFSDPFKLCESNIEFITTMHIYGDKMLIGVTEMDDTPMVMAFKSGELLGLLGL